MDMEYSAMIVYAWMAGFEELNWDYSFQEENGSIIVTDVMANNRLNKFNIFVKCRESDCIVTGVIEQETPEHRRDSMAELICRINYGLIFGSFQIDYSDGQVVFSYPIDVEDGILSGKMITNALVIVCGGMRRFGDAVLDVMEGKKHPADAYKTAVKM